MPNVGFEMGDTNILKQHIGYWLNRLRNAVHYAFEERLAKYDISVAEWCILLSIYDGSAKSVNDIASYIEIDKASVSRVAERLSRKGMLCYKAGDDRRSKVLSLTDEGKGLVPRLIKEAEKNEEYFFGHLSEDEKKQMCSTIYGVLRQIPGMKLSGWLNNNQNNEVVMNEIKNLLRESKKNKWPYPKIFEALKALGVQSYEVHFIDSYKAQYNGDFGSFVEDSLDGYNTLKASGGFSSESIARSIMKHIVEKTHHLDFLEDIASKSCTHYRVDMEERTVTYFNADESASHTENVPSD